MKHHGNIGATAKCTMCFPKQLSSSPWHLDTQQYKRLKANDWFSSQRSRRQPWPKQQTAEGKKTRFENTSCSGQWVSRLIRILKYQTAMACMARVAKTLKQCRLPNTFMSRKHLGIKLNNTRCDDIYIYSSSLMWDPKWCTRSQAWSDSLIQICHSNRWVKASFDQSRNTGWEKRDTHVRCS